MNFAEKSAESIEYEEFVKDIFEMYEEKGHYEFESKFSVTEDIEKVIEQCTIRNSLKSTHLFIEKLFLKGKNEYEIADLLSIPIKRVEKTLAKKVIDIKSMV